MGDTRRAAKDVRSMKEADLYPPIKAYLESLGYTVRGEVNDCDVVGVQGDELVVVELKRNFSTTVLSQAVERQSVADAVYVAIPRPRGGGMKGKWKGVRRLLRRLEVGLLFVGTVPGQTPVSLALHPTPYRPRRNVHARQALLKEFHGRSADYNAGGITGQPILTAYREQALFLARCLRNQEEPMTTRELRELGAGPTATRVLYDNVYGWFTREGRGLYTLSPAGYEALETYRHVIDLTNH